MEFKELELNWRGMVMGHAPGHMNDYVGFE